MPGKHISDIAVYGLSKPEPFGSIVVRIRWARCNAKFAAALAFEPTGAQLVSLARAINRAVRAGWGKLRLIETTGYFGWTWYREED